MTLERIIEGCRKGEADARRELYIQYGRAMYGVIKRYVSDETVAEDLLHDGFIALYTHICDYRGDGSFDGWCRRIFVNTVMSYFRKRNPLAGAEDIDVTAFKSSVKPTAIEEMSAGEIMECVEQLPDGYRTIFNLHAVEEYDYDEIADMLGITAATTRSQFLRARMKLIDIMEKRLHSFGEKREVTKKK